MIGNDDRQRFDVDEPVALLDGLAALEERLDFALNGGVDVSPRLFERSGTREATGSVGLYAA